MKHWIQAARLRTLPLSLSGIFAGAAVATYQQQFHIFIFILSVATTLGLQILSNFANDYGDGVKGTDNDERVGPKRALQSGVISVTSMKNAIIGTSIITSLLALSLILVAFNESGQIIFILGFFVLSLLAIAAAIKYTVGKTAYGYKGLGDVFVFVFFGLVSVIGSHFLYTHEFYFPIIFLGISIGLLSVAVLNLNNMRDIVNDQKVGKNTLAVKWGGAKAKKYHHFLILTAMISAVVFTIFNNPEISHWIYVATFAPLIKHLKVVRENTIPKELDPELKKVALSTFFLSVLLSLGLIIW